MDFLHFRPIHVNGGNWAVVCGNKPRSYNEANELAKKLDYILDNNYLHSSIREMIETIDQADRTPQVTPQKEDR